jgi:aspartate/methionine/tyrosine aminotransferase
MERNRAALGDTFRGTPIHTLHSEGGWSAILQLPKLRTEDAWMTELITRQHVLVQPGYFFDMPSEPYVVVSLLTPEDVFAEGIERLRKAIPE